MAHGLEDMEADSLHLKERINQQTMLSDILLSLYSSTSSEIYSILNRSVYITEFEKNEDAILFHTGFRFKTHKGTQFDVYYDLNSKSIIRQTVGPYPRKSPQLIGFLCGIGDNKYIEKTYYWLATSIITSELQDTNDDNTLKGLSGNDMEDSELLITGTSPINSVTLIGADGKKGVHNSFQIIEPDDKIITLPLQKTFKETVYFNSFQFSAYQPDRFRKHTYFDEEEGSSDYWTCDACGGSSSTGCMSSTGECYK